MRSSFTSSLITISTRVSARQIESLSTFSRFAIAQKTFFFLPLIALLLLSELKLMFGLSIRSRRAVV